MWRPCLGSEVERFFYSECWKVDVVFGAVLHVAAVVLLYLLRCQRVVIYLAFDPVEVVALICEDAEKRAAPCSRATEDH